jgi:hypothetical protein
LSEGVHHWSQHLLQSKIARFIHYSQALLPVAVLAVSAWVHHLAGLTFPVPWDDEAIFIYPAAAVAEANQLQTDSLNAERPVFYHSPGYPIALGIFFKLTQPGLISARWFSWGLLALAYLACLGMVRRLDSRFHASIILSLFFLGGHTAIAGNIARPEALVLALSLSGCWMAREGRPWTAAALLLLGCLAHPAAWFLSAAAAGGYLHEEGWRCPAPQKRDWPWMALAALCFLALAIYVGMRWRWVWNDLQVGINFLHQTWGQRLATLKSPWNGIPAAIVLALPVVTFRLRRPLFSLALLATALWFLPIYRPEMWYSVYAAFAYAFAAVVIIELAARHLPPAARRFGQPVVLGAILLGAFVLGHVPDPRHYPSYFWWRHMTIRPSRTISGSRHRSRRRRAPRARRRTRRRPGPILSQRRRRALPGPPARAMDSLLSIFHRCPSHRHRLPPNPPGLSILPPVDRCRHARPRRRSRTAPPCPGRDREMVRLAPRTRTDGQSCVGISGCPIGARMR